MDKILDYVGARTRNYIGRLVLCRFGLHTKASGYGLDACARGCGFVRNPEALRRWVVTLRSGEEFEVDAVNEYHAGSKVVFGDSAGKIVVDNGKMVLPETKVHRENIVKVRLVA